jgi:hypothetical protein
MRFTASLLRDTVNGTSTSNNGGAMHGSLKAVGYAVVALMAGAALFAFYMSVTHWAGIGV